jgi:hypothetical protein
VPGPHRNRISNTGSRANRERCVVRWWGRSQPMWAALGPRKTGEPRTAADSGGQPTAQVSTVSERWPKSPDYPDCLSHGGSQGFKSPHLHPTPDNQRKRGSSSRPGPIGTAA